MCWKWPPGQGWRVGLEIVPAVHGRDPRATRSAPTSDGAARAGGACGPAGRSGVRRSCFFLFAGLTAQALAFELDAVRIVNDAIQYRIAEGGIGTIVGMQRDVVATPPTPR